jgi:aspartate/methionine/tyrosine aminotransferase
MKDVLPTKPILPPDFIDCSVGEPYLVRSALISAFDLESIESNIKTNDFVYPDPAGHEPLVKLLEDKYNARIVITNGAKQGLSAAFYALQQMGSYSLGTKSPYWALIPPLAKMHGLNIVATDPDIGATIRHYEKFNLDRKHDAYLLVAPNNPDGSCSSSEELQAQASEYKDDSIPFIHDAAYYSHLYLPEDHSLPRIGDVQIHSMSKSLGLSGLRCSYVVCSNSKFYDLIKYYIDHTTVGVSLASQTILFQLLSMMDKNPNLNKKFEQTSRAQLKENKKLCLEISSEVLELPENVINLPGMFLFAKVGPKADFKKSKLNFVDGTPFGMPGYIRMNLAFPYDKMKEVVKRLNSVL